jgi:hypothetical protein
MQLAVMTARLATNRAVLPRLVKAIDGNRIAGARTARAWPARAAYCR